MARTKERAMMVLSPAAMFSILGFEVRRGVGRRRLAPWGLEAGLEVQERKMEGGLEYSRV